MWVEHTHNVNKSRMINSPCLYLWKYIILYQEDCLDTFVWWVFYHWSPSENSLSSIKWSNKFMLQLINTKYFFESLFNINTKGVFSFFLDFFRNFIYGKGDIFNKEGSGGCTCVCVSSRTRMCVCVSVESVENRS